VEYFTTLHEGHMLVA